VSPSMDRLLNSRIVAGQVPAGWAVFRCAAAVLLVAAGLKGLLLKSTPVLPDESLVERWGPIALIGFELGWAAILLLRIQAEAARFASIALFATLALVSVGNGLKGEASCGCFGIVQVNPWLTCVLDLVLLMAFAVSRPPSSRVESSPWGFRSFLQALAVACLLAFVAASLLLERSRPVAVSLGEGNDQDSKLVLLQPSRWIGKPFTLAKHFEEEFPIHQGRWKTYFVREGCPTCHRLVSRLRQAPDPDRSIQRVFVVLPKVQTAATPTFIGTEDAAAVIHLDRRKTWIGRVPFELMLENGVVVSVNQTPEDQDP
jgi:hypothetical protein